MYQVTDTETNTVLGMCSHDLCRFSCLFFSVPINCFLFFSLSVSFLIIVGHFFLDLYPREGKYAHQCVMPISPSFADNGTCQLPAVAMMANMPRGSNGKPALLQHSQVSPPLMMSCRCDMALRQVVTLFHEFGHVMHGVCTKSAHARFSWAWSVVPYPGMHTLVLMIPHAHTLPLTLVSMLAGVEYDFLEVPSMMLENWTWAPNVLHELSSHHETHA